MLKKILTYAIPFTIFVGVFILAIGMIAGNLDGAVITQEKIEYNAGFDVYTWHYYRFHLDRYLLSLQKALDLNQLQYILPQTPTLKDAPSNANILDWGKFIASFMFIYITNWLIYIVNWVVIAPLKLLLYPIHIVIAILGVDTTQQAIINLFEKLYNIEIPLIKDFY